LLPWSGPLFLLAIFALSTLPPSGIFRSEFRIVAGGLGSGNYAAAAVLIVLVTIVFFGLTTSATSMLLSGGTGGGQPPLAGGSGGIAPPEATEPSAWMVVPVLAGMAVLFWLGCIRPGSWSA
jgi:hydrogenase-4 component F